jgi:colanic acid/amylovoran biosynthesis glycosyltransferase
MESIANVYLPKREGLVLVDLGCGTKPYRPIFEPYVNQYIGVDLPGNQQAEFFASLDNKTRLPDSFADIVLSTQVLEHVANPMEYLHECYRILNDPGVLILSTHGYWMYHPNPTDFWRWTSSGLRNILQEAKFHIIHLQGLMGLSSTAIQLLQDALMPKIPAFARSVFAPLMQLFVAIFDRVHSPNDRDRDACVFVCVASKNRDCRIAEPRREIQEKQVISISEVQYSPERLRASNGAGPSICVIHPNKFAYSETFIRAHIERLPTRVKVLYGGWFPSYTEDDRPMLSADLTRRAIRYASRKFLRLSPEYFKEEALKHFLQANKVDAVLAEYGPTGVSVMDACSAAGVPLLVHFHGFDAYDYRTLEEYGVKYQRMFTAAGAIVAVSRDMERQLLMLGAPREKLFYSPYGVDTNLFSGAEPAKVPPIFVAVGRFVDKKAPHLTLLAFKEVWKRCPDARLIMIGDGELWESCKQLARAMEISHIIEFLGPRPHVELAFTMRQVRAFVQHSIRTTYGDSEGTPIVVLEAGAAGIPVVATRHAGIQDVVIDGETGLLVHEGDVEGMARGMIRLAEDPELAGRLGRAARNRIVAEWSIEKSIGQLWNIMERAIQRSGIRQIEPERAGGF